LPVYLQFAESFFANVFKRRGGGGGLTQGTLCGQGHFMSSPVYVCIYFFAPKHSKFSKRANAKNPNKINLGN
jgi:hypothetical protein